MTKYLLYSLPLILLSGCSSFQSSAKDEKHKMEISLQKLRTDVEEVKHDLNSFEVELHILEGKLITQDKTLTSLKEKTFESQQHHLNHLEGKITQLSKKISNLAKSQAEVANDIRKLRTHANETSTALSLYKDKIREVEKVITTQDRKLDEIANLKDTITKLATSAIGIPSPGTRYYQIKAGDSLAKIAQKFRTDIPTLKKLNQLENDLIITGQEIIVPTPD